MRRTVDPPLVAHETTRKAREDCTAAVIAARIAWSLRYTVVSPVAAAQLCTASTGRATADQVDAAFDYSHTPPEELYTVGEFAGRYSTFDESGLPLTDAAGEPVSKSQRKKLKKRLDVHAKKWAGAATAA